VNREDIRISVRSILETNGLRSVGAGAFSGAFVKRGWITSVVFLTTDIGAEGTDRAGLEALVEEARLWCKEHGAATWFVRESGLNLVLFHQGQVSEDLIQGLPDATGTHSAILQSVTAVDSMHRTVVQAKTWIVIGTARRILRRLAGLGDGAT